MFKKFLRAAAVVVILLPIVSNAGDRVGNGSDFFEQKNAGDPFNLAERFNSAAVIDILASSDYQGSLQVLAIRVLFGVLNSDSASAAPDPSSWIKARKSRCVSVEQSSLPVMLHEYLSECGFDDRNFDLSYEILRLIFVRTGRNFVGTDRSEIEFCPN